MSTNDSFTAKSAEDRLIDVGRHFAYLKDDDSTPLTRRLVEMLTIDYMERLQARVSEHEAHATRVAFREAQGVQS